MRLKQIHEQYCEKQRIAEEEAVRLKNDKKQKELEDKMRQEDEIIFYLKPKFINEYRNEIKIIEDAGIQVSYVADWNKKYILYVKLQKGELTTFMMFDENCGKITKFYEDASIITSKEELMSFIYQYFFC